MRVFRWLAGGAIHPRYDLRRLGWRLQDADADPPSGKDGRPRLVGYADLSLGQWLELAGGGWLGRRLSLLIGVDDPAERARLLRLGFGDALHSASTLVEVEARTLRLLDSAWAIPRQRQLGALRLDLLAREAFVAGRPVGLHPREFILLWRLAETPEVPVCQAELLADVWRLTFRPETNTLAVHVSRLRAKLRLAGVEGLIRTGADGSYSLMPDHAATVPALPLATRPDQFGLDDHVRLGKEHSRDRMQAGVAAEQEDNDHDP